MLLDADAVPGAVDEELAEPAVVDDRPGHRVDVLGGDPGPAAATAACWAASSTS